MEKNKFPVLLTITSVVLMVIGRVYFPLALFLSLAPLLALLSSDHKLKYKSFDFLVLIGLIAGYGISAYIANNNIINSLIYSLVTWVSTIAYTFTNKHSRNKIGMLTWVIYWLAMEYVLLKISPDFAITLLGSAFENTTLAPWNIYSGMTGVTCWILIANILLYISLLKDGGIPAGKVRWLSISYSIILIALPVIIASFMTFDQAQLTSETVRMLYRERTVSVEPYKTNGEVFGRTSAWVSVLIVIYAFVKREVK